MREWSDTELAGSQLPDRRHTKRRAHRLERLSEQAVSSIPRACHGWAETLAAYRLLDKPRVGRKEMLTSPPPATRERLQTQEVVLLVQDPTVLPYGTRRSKIGVGTVKDRVREE